MPRSHSESVPAVMQPVYAAVVALTDAFCQEYLNDEYAALARQLAAALARKRPSPLARGRLEIWACAIVYALGSVNFLFDKSEEPYVRADELCAAFGVRQSSGANKAGQIRNMFKMWPLDPKWTLPSRAAENPMLWMIQVNGFIVDVRTMPRDIQELAYKKGLIPYVPADREIEQASGGQTQ